MTDLIKAADALAEAVNDQLSYMDLCGDRGDLERNMRNALTTYRQAREGADGVKVKPLVWVEVPANSSWFYAKTEVGEYRCGWSHQKGFYFAMVGNDVAGLTNMKSLESAKAAAQVDHEARIKAALED